MSNTTNQALLNPAPPAGDEERVQAIFDQVQEAVGFVPDALRLYAISPPLLETFVGNVGYFLQHQTLRGELLAMIRYLVSAEVGCQFCIDLNEARLINAGLDQEAVRAAREDSDKAPLPEKEKALLGLALRAVINPDGIGETDLAAARELGWSDRDIFDAAAQAANNRALNFLLKTFKVEHQGVFA